MDAHNYNPQFNRLSIVAAMILLTYALLPFIQAPSRDLSFSIFGILIPFRLNFTQVLSLMAAGLSAAGTDWLIHDHPRLGKKPVYPHYLLPALTAWVIGIPLGLLKVSLQWWAVFGLGTLLLLGVLLAEYVSVDNKDIRHAPALMVLTAVSFGLFLTLTISIRAAGLRLYLLLFTLAPVCALLCLRLFHLRMQENWNFEWAGGITLVVAQLAMGLYYLPLAPIRYGLILLGIAYALVEFAAQYQPDESVRTKLAGPLLILSLFWVMALFIG
jgi:hypothetical protein